MKDAEQDRMSGTSIKSLYVHCISESASQTCSDSRMLSAAEWPVASVLNQEQPVVAFLDIACDK